MKIQDLKNKKIAILGYWKEWKSTERFLQKLWISDYEILDKTPPLAPPLGGGEYKGVFGDDYLKNLQRFDVIFKTPWISPYNNPELLEVKEKLTSQAEILADNFEWKIIWITGTKGKSTTSTLLYEVLKELGYKVKLVGNIWNPVLDEIELTPSNSPLSGGEHKQYDFIVYELSSYMLEGLDLNIEVGLLNNIYDCHLDWHNWRENYQNAKFNVFKNAKFKLAWEELKNILKEKVMNAGLHSLQNITFFWNDLEKFWIDKKDIALSWEHNYKNISGILHILDKLWILNLALCNWNISQIDNKQGVKDPCWNLEKIKKVLSRFNWLPHRQENIGTYKWIIFIDDGISVTQESTIAAIKTFWNKIWTIFLWWVATWEDYTKLVKYLLKYNIENVVLFPDSWKDMKKFFWEYSPNILETKSMQEAVQFAFKNTKKWEICLLSSASQSYSLWRNYVEKWELFKKYVEKY